MHPAPGIGALEQAAGNGNPHVLIRGQDVGHQGRHEGGHLKARHPTNQRQNGRHEPRQGPGGLHHPGEDHGAEDKPDRIEHARHAPSGEEAGNAFHTALAFKAGVEHGPAPRQGRWEPLKPCRRLGQGRGVLGQQREQQSQQRSRRDHGYGREAQHGQGQQEDQRQEAQGPQVVFRLKRRGQLGKDIGARALRRSAQPGEEQQGYGEGGQGGPQHVADMGKEIGLRNGSGEIRGLREGRHFVPEISAGDDGAGGDHGRKPQRFRRPHKGDAHGPGGGPGTTDGQGDQRADQAARRVIPVWGKQLRGEEDQIGHGSREYPGTDEGPHGQKNEAGGHGHGDGPHHRRFEGGPAVAMAQSQKPRHQGCEQQGDLVRTVGAVFSINGNGGP